MFCPLCCHDSLENGLPDTLKLIQSGVPVHKRLLYMTTQAEGGSGGGTDAGGGNGGGDVPAFRFTGWTAGQEDPGGESEDRENRDQINTLKAIMKKRLPERPQRRIKEKREY